MSAKHSELQLPKTSFQGFTQSRRLLADGETIPQRLGFTAGVLALSNARRARGELRFGGTDMARSPTIGEETAAE